MVARAHYQPPTETPNNGWLGRSHGSSKPLMGGSTAGTGGAGSLPGSSFLKLEIYNVNRLGWDHSWAMFVDNDTCESQAFVSTGRCFLRIGIPLIILLYANQVLNGIWISLFQCRIRSVWLVVTLSHTDRVIAWHTVSACKVSFLLLTSRCLSRHIISNVFHWRVRALAVLSKFL